MLSLGAEAWILIDIPNFSPRETCILAQLDSEKICILGGFDEDYKKTGVILNAKTGAVVRKIKPANEIRYTGGHQSFLQHSGQILSLVTTMLFEVHLISFNPADDSITTVHNLGVIY